MTPERWQQIDRIFQAVVELDPDSRQTFLDSACSTDPDLRREVESLIASDGQGFNLIEGPAVEAAATLLLPNGLETAAGQQLGQYRIISLLGSGGMGEVYLAKDTRLDRNVALKLLLAEHTDNPQWLKRFYKEARAVSALNHPNILTIHEISKAEGFHFIATEFIDGETLRQRLRRSKLNLSEALDIAVQVANALAAAHQAGIVHRDIKPENIMLRHDGYVKVVDFGLADLPSARENRGAVMGTLRYMSPEQTYGMAEDPRSDIFSFGVVLYEMIAGRTPFENATAAGLVRTIREEALPPLPEDGTSAAREMRRIVEKMLQKEQTGRYATIDDSLSELDAVKKQIEDESRPERKTSRRRSMLLSAALVFTLSIAGYSSYLAFVHSRDRAQTVSIGRIANTEKAMHVAISPDGRYVAHADQDRNGKESLQLRDLQTAADSVLVAETDPLWPAFLSYCGITFSKDGSHIYFVPKADNNGVLYRIPTSGGTPEKVLDGVATTVSFSPDGKQMAFLRNIDPDESALVITNVDGSGERTMTTRKSPQSFENEPAWSPDGRVIAVVGGTAKKGSHILTVDAGSGAQHPLSNAIWEQTERMFWLSDGSGLVLAGGLAQTRYSHIWFVSYPGGDTRVVVDDLNSYSDITLTADSNTLAALRFEFRGSLLVAPHSQLDQAKVIASSWEPLVFRAVAWSADGRIVYPSNASGESRDLWVLNSDGSNPKRLTARGGPTETLQPAVSPDGKWIVFAADWNKPGDNIYNIWKVRMDGSDAVQLTHGDGEIHPTWSADGKWVLYVTGGPNEPRLDKRNLWVVPAEGGTSQQITNTPSSWPAVSPDGRFIATWFKENRQSPWKVAIIPFGLSTPVKTLEVRSGLQPLRWLPDGSAITYINTVDEVSNIWSQPIDGGEAKQLTHFGTETIQNFAWSKDGKLVCSRYVLSKNLVLIRNFR